MLPIGEDHGLAPVTAYTASKAATELYLSHYRSMRGIDCRVARMSNPFGAGQNAHRGQGAITTFAHQALTGQTIEVWGDGEIVRDYLHISDCAAALVSLAVIPDTHGEWIFNVGSGSGTSVNEVLRQLERNLNRELDVRFFAGRAFDVPANVLDIARARQILGWSPQLSVEEGCARTIHDLRDGSGLCGLSTARVRGTTFRNGTTSASH